MRQWDPQQAPLVLRKRWNETQDTVSFIFEAQDQGLIHFKPGQFVTVKVRVNDHELARAYSISSLPGQNTLQLTVKRVVGGVVSNWLADHLKPGDLVWTLGIAGAFNIVECKVKPKLMFISAGCGITPVLCMAKYLCALKEGQPEMVFLHRAHDMCNVISLADINLLAQQSQRFQYHLLLSDTKQPYPDYEGKMTAGTLTIEQLRTLCPDYSERAVFLCGPQGFMQDVEDMFSSNGFDMQYFHHEDFTPRDNAQQGYAQRQTPAGAAVAAAHFTVNVPDFAYQAKVAKGSTLLDVLDEGDVPVIGACRTGVCGSCKCRITKGRVASVSQSTLKAKEIEQGFVLACSSQVIEDIEVALK